MWLLFLDMLERVGFVIATAFLLSRSKKVRKYMNYEGNLVKQLLFILLFGFFGILGTYTGVPVVGLDYERIPWINNVSDVAAIANTRAIGVVIAGLLGGVKAGVGAGLISGVHRYTLGGFTAFGCMVSTIVEGLIAGLSRFIIEKYFNKKIGVPSALLVGAVAESIHMGMILSLEKPVELASQLVSVIAFPMIAANSLGVALFFALLIQVEREEDRIGAYHAYKALQIADKTLPHWKKPINEAVREIALILVDQTRAVGAMFVAKDHPIVREGVTTPFFLDLQVGDNVRKIGFFRLFYQKEEQINQAEQTIIKGLSQLFYQQFVLTEAQRQAGLRADAEIRALQAQMNPHFLFNVLNTIKSYIRTRPEEARQLVMNLARFLRKNIQSNNRPLFTIGEELEHVSAYLELEKARIGDKVEIAWNINEDLLGQLIPPLTIQPLVENAIVHGLSKKMTDGRLAITVEQTDGGVMVEVADNGIGMRAGAYENGEEHMGMALTNINQRLSYYFGQQAILKIKSEPGQGTTIRFVLPEEKEKWLSS